MKNDIVKELFVRTADENYITARWCAINYLNTDFLWLSVHALEKYLKAMLLMNGCSAKSSTSANNSYGHDIVRLYTDVKTLAGPLLPDRLSKPDKLDVCGWFERTPEQFMEHLLANGNADNRYLIYGYVTYSQDLHMLDQMVFSIRRLICALDERWLLGSARDTATFTHRELLIRKANYYTHLAMPLDKAIDGHKDSTIRATALNLNMAFAPAGFQHEAIWAGNSSRHPVIIRRILDPLESDNPQRAAEGVEIALWLLANVKVPNGKLDEPSVTKQIQTAIKVARAKHGLR